MKAIVLAAGEGSRLRPLTAERPKPLVEVNGVPLLTHCLRRLAKIDDIDEIVTVVGVRGDQIIDYYGDTFEGLTMTYARQREPRGLADALLAAANEVSDTFVLTYGDVIFRNGLGTCLDRHQEIGADATLLIKNVSRDQARQSGVCVINEKGEITAIIEKPSEPPSTLALPGFFVFDPVILSACQVVTPSDRGEYELLDAIDLLVHAGRTVETVRLSGWQVNVNTPGDLELAERKISREESP